MKFPCLNSFTIDLHMWTPLESWDVYIVLRESSLVAGGIVHDGSIPIDKSMNFPVGASPSDFLVINPVNGFTFSAADPNCPLQEIACLATTTNVFANVQQGNLLLIYICIFHVLSHLLLIYICKTPLEFLQMAAPARRVSIWKTAHFGDLFSELSFPCHQQVYRLWYQWNLRM